MHPIEAAAPDFDGHLVELGETDTPFPVWEHSLEPIERGLEIWMGHLSALGRTVWVKAAAAAGRHVYPIPRRLSQDDRFGFQFYEDEEEDANDGEPPGLLIRRVEAWLAEPCQTTFEAVSKGIDRTRQLNVWDEDLYPAEDGMWAWFLEVGQLTALSLVADEEWKPGRREEAYTWPAQVCAARAMVCALKTMAEPKRDIAGDVRALGQAVAKAFE